MTEETKDTLVTILRDYGFATAVACALLYTARTDVLIPMVEAHREFLRELSLTQREITRAVTEQTKILYAMQAHHEQAPPKVSAEKATEN